ncbi:MAG: PDZ domain-containing protein [Roseiflexaceae bacterium]|nr:PDZ domain-containing protein [Roseiflexus sp.]MDW8212128.1 PDZ domain-containing protein [Roseiflexaceae bacterium]
MTEGVSRPWWIAGLIAAIAFLCIWCGVFAGIGGWVAGRDIGRREARLELSATAALQPVLPELGVLVTRLDRNGPAARAGVARGDVIVAIEGVYVQDARDLRDQLLRYRAGDTVRLTILRDRDEQTVSVALGAFPGNPRLPYLGVYYTARGEEPADL